MDENRGLTMRDIIFRGKREDNGEWIAESETYIKDGDGTWLSDESHDVVKVIPETVGEFTGVTDKNGRKIFERDIVKRGDRIWIIEYDVKCAQFVMKTFTERGVFFIRSFDLIPSEWCEVIGNKFDNPELLEGGNDNE